ncbi:MAG: hypothetical protein GY861_08205, partial [bacterium]|nr:hypothetical protein [bacterium]
NFTLRSRRLNAPDIEVESWPSAARSSSIAVAWTPAEPMLSIISVARFAETVSSWAQEMTDVARDLTVTEGLIMVDLLN